MRKLWVILAMLILVSGLALVAFGNRTVQNDAGTGGDASNTFDTATLISASSYTGELGGTNLNYTDTDDYYKFYVNSGQIISVSLSSPSGADFDLKLYNPSGYEKDSSTSSGLDSITYTADSSGYWRTRMYVYTDSGTYSFTLSIGGTAQNHAGTLRVIVVCEDKTYKIGDSVTTTVHVLSGGEHIEPDSAPTVWLNKGENNERTISVSKISTGVYRGTFTIMSTDVVSEYGYISIEARATYNGQSESDYISIYVYGLSVFVDISNSAPKPGDTVSITVTVREDNTNVDADLDLEIYSEYTGSTETLTHTREDTGVYKANYYIISSLTEGTYFSITAKATYGDRFGEGYVMFCIAFYDIWYHKLSVTETSASFELWVSDMEGNAVSEASIKFTHDSQLYPGMTDNSGKASFTITYSSTDYVSIDGTVTKDGKTQPFEGYIEHQEGEPDSYGFDVVSEMEGMKSFTSVENFCKAGSTASLEFTAYNDGTPLTSQIIYYYITTSSILIESGQRTTDSNGEFNLHFTIPGNAEGMIHISFETKIMGYYGYEYETDSEYIPIFGGIDINVDALRLGGKTRITATSGDSGFGLVMCVPLDVEGQEPSWSRWTGIGGWGSFIFFNVVNEEFSGDILLPEFMPNTRYLILVVDYGMMGYSGMRMNYVLLNPGESTYSQGGLFGGGVMGIIWISIILFIVIASLGLGVYFVRRRTRRAPTMPRGLPTQEIPQPEHRLPEQPAPAQPIPTQQYMCPSCSQPLTYIQQHQRWYCYHCQRYV